MSLYMFFKMGGVIMWPLLAFSIAAVGIAVERVIYLLYHNLRVDDMAGAVLSYIKEDNAAEAAAYLGRLEDRRPGASVLRRLLEARALGTRLMEKAAETEAAAVVGKMENGFDFLSAIGALAPLTGFLGTVTGMISAFKSIAEATEVNAQIVANGIYEALITTVFGLIIAIVAMVASSLLTHVVDNFAAAADKAASDIIAAFASRGA